MALRRLPKFLLLSLTLLVFLGGLGGALIVVDQPQLFSKPVFDSTPPPLSQPNGDFNVLIFSKTNGFRHREAIPAARAMIESIASEKGWGVEYTENGAVFNSQQLGWFDVVVWSSATGPALSINQQKNFEKYVADGGGYVGLHAAGDDSHSEWAWYSDEVIRCKFTMHPLFPQLQDALLTVEDRDHSATQHLPDSLTLNDEWYSWDKSVRAPDVTVVATLDEETYDPNFWPMGEDHPIIWYHEKLGGRVFYSALGHGAMIYKDERYRRLIQKAIGWAGLGWAQV